MEGGDTGAPVVTRRPDSVSATAFQGIAAHVAEQLALPVSELDRARPVVTY